MIPKTLWIASFVHLALVAAFVCTAVREDDDLQLILKTLAFFGMIVGGTLAFCGVIFLVEMVF